MLVVKLYDALARRAASNGSFFLYFSDEDLPDSIDVGDVLDIHLIDTSGMLPGAMGVVISPIGTIRAELVEIARTSISNIRRSLLMDDVVGYRTRRELLRTMTNRIGHITETDPINVLVFRKWDYDLSALSEMVARDMATSGGVRDEGSSTSDVEA